MFPVRNYEQSIVKRNDAGMVRYSSLSRLRARIRSEPGVEKRPAKLNDDA